MYMNNKKLLGTRMLLWFLPLTISAQNESPSLQINKAELIESVVASFYISSPRQPLFVPDCGESEGGRDTFCNGTIHIEVKTQQGWRPLQTRKGMKLGGVGPEQWKTRMIPAGHGSDLSFAFDKKIFVVEHGQLLRAVVDVWTDEQSMKSGTNSLQLISQPFECP